MDAMDFILPNGAIVAVVDPHKRTIRFVMHTDEGEQECDAPPGYRAPFGYRIAGASNGA